MGDIADAAGLAPDLAFAIRKTGLLVTQRNQDRLDDDQRAAWTEALAEYKMLEGCELNNTGMPRKASWSEI